MKLGQLGEFGFIDRIASRVGPAPGVRLGIGDDCAATVVPAGELLLTTSDLLIEEVHFRRQWTNLRDLGRKSVAVNLSDIAAMGGTPRHLYLGLGIPQQMRVEDLDAFMDGLLAEAESYGVMLVGGDTCSSPGPLLISVTVEGGVPEAELVTRGGARSGDAIYVSGTLGDSALALHKFQMDEAPDPYLAQRHHVPQARTGLGRALARARTASAMIDISDGLLADLGHVLKASCAGARLERQEIPLSAPFRRELGKDGGLWDLALAGGEDYELLFTVPPERQAGLDELAGRLEFPLTRIGVITPSDDGIAVKDSRGQDCPLPAAGFNHFASTFRSGRE